MRVGTLLNLAALDPDGVEIIIPWGEMDVGSSVFIPCINTIEAMRQVRTITKFWGWRIHGKAMAKNDIWGLRIWRIT